jgi:hypothetical protein
MRASICFGFFVGILAGALAFAVQPALAQSPFDSTRQYVTSGEGGGVALADFDGDGDLDAAMSHPVDGAISILLNQGGAQGGAPGVFLYSLTKSAGDTPYPIEAADLDGDGDPDLVVANTETPTGDDDPTVSVFMNLGGLQGGVPGMLSDATNLICGLRIDKSPQDLALVDVERDGDIDIVAPIVFTMERGLCVLVNEGGAQGGTEGTFAAQVIYPVGVAVCLTPGDFDGDGDIDFLTGDGGENIRFVANQGGAQGGVEGEFMFQAGFTTQENPDSLASGDIDADGDLDVVYVPAKPNASDKMTILYNMGGIQNGNLGDFGNETTFGGTRGAQNTILADFDGDGDLDVISADGAYPPGRADKITIVFNQGGAQGGVEGTFGPANTYAGVGATPYEIRAADLDGDGDLDLAAANNAASALAIVLNRGGAQGGVEGEPLVFENTPLGTPPSDIVLVDVDNDDDLDIMTVGNVMRNQGGVQGGVQGSFGFHEPFEIDPQSLAVVAGDFDGDGDADLATAKNTTTLPNVLVLFNQGNAQGGALGTFDGRVDYGAGDDPRRITAGDIDGDADLDLIVINRDSDDAHVLVNQGGLQGGTPGNFVTSAPLVCGNEPASMALDDLDNDDDLDFVVTNNFGNTLSIFFNQGGLQGGTEGDLGTATIFAGLTRPYGLRLGDLDNDGDADIVVSARTMPTSGISILLNQGGKQGGTPGQFAASVILADIISLFITDIALFDMDSDGDLDLAGTETGFDRACLFINQGGLQEGVAGDFGAAILWAASSLPGPIQAGDLDGDGQPDIVLGNGNSGNGTLVFRNGLSQLSAARVAGGRTIDVEFTRGILNDVSAASYAFSGSGLGTLAAAPDSLEILDHGLRHRLRWNSGAMTAGGDIDVVVAPGPRDISLDPLAFNFSASDAGGAVVDSIAPQLMSGQIELLDPTPTMLDAVRFAVDFDESVQGSFDASDITLLGSLSGTVAIIDSDPAYEIIVTMDDPEAGGAIGIEIAGGTVIDLGGNPFAGATSALYTILGVTAADADWQLFE